MSTDNMFRWDQDDAGIVTLTMDDPNAPVNTMNKTFQDDIRATVEPLSFGSGPSFLSAGVPNDRDALVAGAGLDLAVAPNASLGVAYTGQVGARAQDQAVKGNFTLRF